jgi:hypothetical protein
VPAFTRSRSLRTGNSAAPHELRAIGRDLRRAARVLRERSREWRSSRSVKIVRGGGAVRCSYSGGSREGEIPRANAISRSFALMI